MATTHLASSKKRCACVGVGFALFFQFVMFTGCTEHSLKRRRSVSTHPHLPMPDGPVARPVLDSSYSTRVLVETRVLGNIEYDTQTLPLVQPSGERIVVQQGVPNPWSVRLALPPGRMDGVSSIATYALDSFGISRIESRTPLPPGLLLGRDTDDEGYLVELAQEDGTRRIGKINWVTHKLVWLTEKGQVAAHGMLTTEGDLVYCRREIESERFSVVLRTKNGQESEYAHDSASLLFPMCTSDPSVLYAAAIADDGIRLLSIRVSKTSHGRRIVGVLAQRKIANSTNPRVAFKATLPMRTTQSRMQDHLLFYHPQLRRIAVWDFAQDRIGLLPARSIAAVPVDSGYFSTTPDGLVYTPSIDMWKVSQKVGWKSREANVLKKPYVPIEIKESMSKMVLVGPGAVHTQLEIALLWMVGKSK